jgi:hypothetical protein
MTVPVAGSVRDVNVRVAACESVLDAGDVMTDAMVVPSAIPGPVITWPDLKSGERVFKPAKTLYRVNDWAFSPSTTQAGRSRLFPQPAGPAYLRWIVMPEEIRSRFWSLPARLGSRVYP